MAFHTSVRLGQEINFESYPPGKPRTLAYQGGARRIPLDAPASTNANAVSTPNVVASNAALLHSDAMIAAMGLCVQEVARLAAATPGGSALLERVLTPTYIQIPLVSNDFTQRRLADALASQLAAQAALLGPDDADAATLAASYGYGPAADERQGRHGRRPSFAASSSSSSSSASAANTPTPSFAVGAGSNTPGPHTATAATTFHLTLPHGVAGGPAVASLSSPNAGNPSDSPSPHQQQHHSHQPSGGSGTVSSPKAAVSASPQAATTVQRIGLLDYYGNNMQHMAILPEIAWLEAVPPPSSSSSSKPTYYRYLCLAEGEGRLSDAATGALIYAGSWRAGMRHGTGRAAIVAATPPASGPTTSSSAAVAGMLDLEELGGGGYDGSFRPTLAHSPLPTSSITSTYEGDWRLGQRHGRGILTDNASLTEAAGAGHGGVVLIGPQAVLGGGDGGAYATATTASSSSSGGDRYDGGWYLDHKHGSGVEAQAGGGVYRGHWCAGLQHGCGVFTWPNAGSLGLGLGWSAWAAAAGAAAGGGASNVALRSEYRQYHHGRLLAVRPVLPPSFAAAAAAATLPASAASPGSVGPGILPTGSMIHLPNAMQPATAAAVPSGGIAGSASDSASAGSAASFARVMSQQALNALAAAAAIQQHQQAGVISDATSAAAPASGGASAAGSSASFGGDEEHEAHPTGLPLEYHPATAAAAVTAAPTTAPSRRHSGSCVGRPSSNGAAAGGTGSRRSDVSRRPVWEPDVNGQRR